MKTKYCPKCKKYKYFNKFGKNCTQKYGLSCWCKNCCSKQGKEVFYKNQEKINTQHRKWYQNNKIKRLKQIAEYQEKNKQFYKKYRKTYFQENKEKIMKKNYERIKIRNKTDKNFRISTNLQGRLYYLMVTLNPEPQTSLHLIGCSVDELKYHLQKKFKRGMSWDNYGIGGWQIDHIKPRCLFNLIKPSEQRKCFHYSNLQPLWESENWSKGY